MGSLEGNGMWLTGSFSHATASPVVYMDDGPDSATVSRNVPLSRQLYSQISQFYKKIREPFARQASAVLGISADIQVNAATHRPRSEVLLDRRARS